jgi:ribosomal protein S18 acetylase RimI-like enzyme
MLKIEQINSNAELKNATKQEIIDFLHQHLEQFGDSKQAIEKCIDYAFSENHGKGGFVLTGHFNNALAGVVVMNKTGMAGYIPENILVYIAVDGNLRGKGIGAKLMQEAINRSQGDIKLHVEYENPAKRLYERLGFKSKYAEMRFTKAE